VPERKSVVSSSIGGSEFAAINGYDAEKPRVSPGDAMIEAIAEAVAIKLSRMAAMSQRLMDVEEAAKYLGMTPHALRHKAAVDIPCVRIDTRLRFDRRDLDRYIDRAKREGL
jgi:hypothetical protein